MALFAAAAVLLAMSFVNIHRMAVLREARDPALLHARLPPEDRTAEAASQRPANVGNARADSFLRSVEKPAAVPEEGVIHIRDEDFSAAYDELYDKREQYYGRSVDLAGIVMNQGDLGPGGFLVGRKLLWCCELDTYFIGFLAYTDGPVPNEGSKVRVRGVLTARDYRNPENGKTFQVPSIRVERLDAEPGVSEYVYPSSSP